MAAKVVHAHFALVFTGDQQQVFKTQLADGGALAGDFCLVQRLTFDAVAHRKTAVGAVIGAEV